MLTSIKTGIERIGKRVRDRRDYNYLLQHGDNRLLRDIGIDRVEVERMRARLRLL